MNGSFNQRLNDELLTAVIEVEGVLNSRPLLYVSVDDLDEPLTTSHLLSGRRSLRLADHLYCEPDNKVLNPVHSQEDWCTLTKT